MDNAPSKHTPTPWSNPISSRRRPRLTGFFPDPADGSAWIKRRAELEFTLPAPAATLEIAARDLLVIAPGDPSPGTFFLEIFWNGRLLATLPWREGFQREHSFPVEGQPGTRARLTFRLAGVGLDNLRGGLDRLQANLTGDPAVRESLRDRRRRRWNRRFRFTALRFNGQDLCNFARQPDPVNPFFGLDGLPLGLNIVGWFRGHLGLGESARSSVRACDAAGLPAAVINLRTPCLSPLEDTSQEARLQEAATHPCSLYHINPPETPELRRLYPQTFFHDRYHIAYWAWELPEFPDGWVTSSLAYDEIWCPSRFVAEAISRKCSRPVLVMPHAVDPVVPPGRDWRANFNLSPDRTVFLFAFDFNSYFERKNPLGVIEAFRRAFKPSDPAQLVIKCHGGKLHPGPFAVLQHAAAGHPGIRLFDASLTREAMTGLQSACDVFVSLHRSEGFGLNLAECMALGKPVVATHWSAPAEYLHHDNGWPIPARLQPLASDIGPYRRGHLWAEPDLDAAAHALRELAARPELRASLGAAARATIAERFAPPVVGRLYRDRLRWIAFHQST